VRTSDIDPGGSETLDLSSLKVGTYTIFCEISGHKDAGMQAVLMVGTMGAGAASNAVTAAQNDRLDEQQKAPVDEYVAQLENGANTEGVGA